MPVETKGLRPMILAVRARYMVLGALSLLYVLLMAATFNSLGQVLPFMVADLGMSWTEAGFGFTLLGVACGLASLAPAVLIRRLGVSLTLLVGMLLLLGGFAALAWTHGVAAYHLGTILLGLGFCFCGPIPSVHVISTLFTRRSTALGIYFTIGSLGAVAGPIFFYLVNEASNGWRGYWLLCALATLAIGGFAVLVTRDVGEDAMPSPPRVEDVGGWTLRDALATPQFWIIVAAYTGCLLVNTTVHGSAFQHLMEHGQGKGAATFWISLAAFVGAGGSAAAGLIGERVDGRRLTMLSLAMLSITAASLAMIDGVATLTVFAVSMGIGLGFSYVSTAMLMRDYFGGRAGLELYSTMTVVSTSAAIGPGLGGVVRDHTGGFTDMFVGLAIIGELLLVAVAAMRRPGPRPVAAIPFGVGPV